MRVFEEGDSVNLIAAQSIDLKLALLQQFLSYFDENGVAVAEEAYVFGVNVLAFDFAELQGFGLQDELLALVAEFVDQIEDFLVDVSADFVVSCLLHVLPREDAREDAVHFDVLGEGLAENYEGEIHLVSHSSHQDIVLQQLKLYPSPPFLLNLSPRQILVRLARRIHLGGGRRGVQDSDGGVEDCAFGVEDVVKDVGELLRHLSGLPSVFL